MLGLQKPAGAVDIFQMFQPPNHDNKVQHVDHQLQQRQRPQQQLHTHHQQQQHPLSRQPTQPPMREHAWRNNEKLEHTRLHRRVVTNHLYGHSSHDEPPAPDYDLPEDWDHLEDEYAAEYEAYMLQLEAKSYPVVEHMEMQTEITWDMRPVLVDFLVQVHSQYRLRPETLFLAVNMMDRYLSRRLVRRMHYQLLGMACLWVAAKYEDVKDNVPTVHDLWFMCQSTYSEKEFIMMEAHVVHCLRFDVGHPTQEAWMKYFLVKGDVQAKTGELGPIEGCGFRVRREDRKRVHDVARYIAEVACFHKQFIAWAPSVMAKSALHLAIHILGLPQPAIGEGLSYIYQLEAILASSTAVVLQKYSHPCLSNATDAVKSYLATATVARPAAASWASPRRQPSSAEVRLERSRTCCGWVAPDAGRIGGSMSMQLRRGDTLIGTQAHRQQQQQQYLHHQQQHPGKRCDAFSAAVILPRALGGCGPPTPITPTMVVGDESWKVYPVEDRRTHFTSAAQYRCS